MFFFLANFFFEPVQVIGNQYNQALAAMAGAERFFRLIDLEPEWQDAPSATPCRRIAGPRRISSPSVLITNRAARC